MSFTQSPFFWMILAVITAAGIYLYSRPEKPDSGHGFRDVVKNPEEWREMMDKQDEMVEREIEAARQWDEKRIEEAVRHFIFEVRKSDETWMEKRILKSLGARTHPLILQVLHDKANHVRLRKTKGSTKGAEAPIQHVCELFEDEAPVESAEFLAPWLADPSDNIRKSVALVLGSIGTPETIEPLRKALKDSDGYVRSHALLGLERALKRGVLHESCRRELFADLQPLVERGEFKDREAAELLMKFDEKKAAEFFLSPAVFSSESPSLHEVLEALANRKVSVPRERLLKLIEELQTETLEYPKTYSLGEALRLLGQHRQPEDRALLEQWMNHAEERTAQGAATGLLASFDLEDFRKRLLDKEQAEGYAALSSRQKHYFAVFFLDAEVNNGGHAQYFFNSSGDRWREAMTGLEAMRMTQRTAILREALAKFKDGQPSTDREVRQDQLAKIASDDDEIFDALDTRHYQCSEVIEAFAARYVIKHAEAFR